MSETVLFEPNVPVQVALRFSEPRKYQGNWGERLLFSLVDGRVMYLDPPVYKRIQDLGVETQELFWICKKWKGGKGERAHWDVWLDPATEKARARAEAPSLEAQLRHSLQVVEFRKNGRAPEIGVSEAPTLKESSPVAVQTQDTPSPAIHQGWAQFLLSQTDALIDVYAAALKYSAKYEGLIKGEDVRSILVTAFIQQCSKNGGPHVA